MLPNEPNNPSKDFSLDPASTSPELDHTLLSENAAQSLVNATVIQAIKSGAKPETTSRSVSVPGYEIDGILGRGGMGVVYKARDRKLKRTVALKMVLAGGHAAPRELARFRIEAEAVARLQHPNIVQIYEIGEADGFPYCVLEFVDGGNLASRISGRPIPAIEAAKLVELLARAMQLAHSRNVVHRDLKPANVLLSADGTPKITDFGLARHLDDDSGATQAGAVMGTPSYMAPCQAAGQAHSAGPPADIYALGAILYDCLTGRPPFKGNSVVETLDHVRTKEPVAPSRLEANIPLDLETICLKCLRKEPENRYASAAELAEDLRRFVAGEPIRARASSRTERLVKWIRRRPAAAGLLAAMLMVLLLTGALLVIQYGRIASEKERDFAQAQRHRAESAEGEALRQLQLAENARTESHRQWERAENLVYVGLLSRAQTAWEEGNARDARSFLNASRPELRGWEYDHLRQRFDETHVTLRGHDSGVLSVSFSPDGKRLASAGEDQIVKVWDAATGQVLLTLAGHTGRVHGVAFSPDGRLLASAGMDETVKLWDATTGLELYSNKAATTEYNNVCFSPDGKSLACGSFDATVKLWDVETGKELPGLYGHHAAVLGICFSSDGQRLVTSSNDSMVKVWHVGTRQEIFTFREHRSGVYSVGFSPDGKQIASGDWLGRVKLWNAETGHESFFLKGHSDTVFSVSFSPDGKQLASGGMNQAVKIWDTTTGQEDFMLTGHEGRVRCVCFSPDGSRLASSGWDKTVKLWDAAKRQDLLLTEGYLSDANSQGHQHHVSSVAISPDGNLLAVSSWDSKVRLWDIAAGQEKSISQLHTGIVTGVSFSPDGELLASCGADRTVKLLNLNSGQVLHTLNGHDESVSSVCFSSDGRHIASGSVDQTVKLWDALSGQQLITVKGHAGNVRGVCFSPNGKVVASGSDDGKIMVSDTSTGQNIATLTGHTGGVTSVSFSSDGKKLASSSSSDWKVKLWETDTWKELATLQGHNEWVEGVCFSADGKRLASAGRDGKVRLWDTGSTQEILFLDGHRGYVTSVCFSSDGKRLVSGASGGTVRLWETATCNDQASSELVFTKSLNDSNRLKRWHRAEAAASEAKQQWFAAAFHLRQLLSADEADAVQLQETLKRCEDNVPAGSNYPAGSQQEALGYLAAFSAGNYSDTSLSLRIGAQQAWFRMDREYDETCRRLLEFARDTRDPIIGERTAKICSLRASHDKTLLDAALSHARMAVELGQGNPFLPYFQMSLGMAEYRNDLLAEADQTLAAAMEGDKDNPYVTGTSAFYRAMCRFRQGKQAEARQLATEAAGSMRPIPEDKENPLADRAGADDLILWLAYMEAKDLIQF